MIMKSILLKIDDDLFKDLEASVKEFKISKTAFIKDALYEAISNVKRKKLASDLKKEIAIINTNNLDKELISDFETASLEDLNNN